jgi:phosphoglycolate phosphatase
MNPQLLIFDLDGTLIDSRADLAEGVNYMRGQYQLPPLSLAVVSSYIGDGIRALVTRSLQDAEIDLEEALNIYRDYYYTHLTAYTTLYAGVPDGIAKLSAVGHKLAVLTNKPGDPSRRILDHFGLLDCFCAVIGGGDVDRLKPEPQGLFRCLKRSGMDATETWMIGDHCTDLAVAENAGVKSAFAQYGFGEERGFKPDAYFASFQDLVGYFA